MKPYKRPEMELDPDKAPGQIINRPPHALYLRDVIARIQQSEATYDTRLSASGCCGERCEGCPYATINS